MTKKKPKKVKAEKDYALVAPTPVVDQPTEAEQAWSWVNRGGLVDRWKDSDFADGNVPAATSVEFNQALASIPWLDAGASKQERNAWFAAMPKPTTPFESEILFKVQQQRDGLLHVEPKPEESSEASGKGVPTPTAPPTPYTDSVVREIDRGLATVIEAPADPVLENGNGQPIIHYLDPNGVEKVKGYTRVTTYIDGLDDKTVLTKWKMRTLLEGAAQDEWAVGGSDHEDTRIRRVMLASHRLDEALADIDRREKEEGELLELRRQELLKGHRTLLESIAEELMELGGAHEKANKGTNLHRLTEIVDNGGDLPADTTASDRRDVEAYQAKMAELDLRVLWCERRVVLDDIQVSGTMDRAYQVKLPGMQRRIRVVGDLKTGSVSWGHGKIGQQLALYAQGLGYDWTKPLERQRLGLSKAHGLLIHLPQGEGRCEVYLVDLELAREGLELSKRVREWRNTQKRLYNLKSPLVVS